MNILITGINGFVGRNFAKLLLQDKNINITGIGRQINCDLPNVNFYSIDITKSFYIDKHFDYVFHFAALSRTNVDVNYSYEKIYDVNINGMINTLNCCKFNKFVFLSSTLVYNQNSERISETSSINATSYYSKTKYEGELIIRETLPQEKYVILRVSNLTGEDQAKVSAVPVFWDRAIRNENINIFVPKNKHIQLLHIDDFTRLLLKIINKNIQGLFNVSSLDSIEIIDLVQKITHICGSSSKVICSNNELIGRSIIDSQKISDLLNWEPLIDIKEILIRFWRSYNDKHQLFGLFFAK